MAIKIIAKHYMGLRKMLPSQKAFYRENYHFCSTNPKQRVSPILWSLFDRRLYDNFENVSKYKLFNVRARFDSGFGAISPSIDLGVLKYTATTTSYEPTIIALIGFEIIKENLILKGHK